MDLAQHTDQPVTIDIAGVPYRFSELPIEALGRLQRWIKDHHPNPLEVIRPYLAGFSAADRAEMIRQARQEAAGWPPQVGTSRGAQALLGDEPGQVEALCEGLLVHQPGTTREEAARIYRALDRRISRARALGVPDATAERTVSRIFAILFGTGDPGDLPGEGDDPKAPAAPEGAGGGGRVGADPPSGSTGT